MNQGASIASLLLLALVLANAPFFFARFLLLGPIKQARPIWLLLEIALAYAIFIAAGLMLEQHFGQLQAQGWQFYVVSACLFLSMGFPGFVLRFLLKK